MKLLEDMIREQGKWYPGGIVKVDGFLNHQMDWKLYREMGREFFRLFGGEGVTKILTIESSGIGIACITAQFFQVPAIFAKKRKSQNLAAEVYTTQVESYTHGGFYEVLVSKEWLLPEDRVLIVDDFMANGQAALGLRRIVEQAGATLVGVGVAIEKGFQPGGRLLRELGVRVEPLALIESMSDTAITFKETN